MCLPIIIVTGMYLLFYICLLADIQYVAKIVQSFIIVCQNVILSRGRIDYIVSYKSAAKFTTVLKDIARVF